MDGYNELKESLQSTKTIFSFNFHHLNLLESQMWTVTFISVNFFNWKPTFQKTTDRKRQKFCKGETRVWRNMKQLLKVFLLVLEHMEVFIFCHVHFVQCDDNSINRSKCDAPTLVRARDAGLCEAALQLICRDLSILSEVKNTHVSSPICSCTTRLVIQKWNVLPAPQQLKNNHREDPAAEKRIDSVSSFAYMSAEVFLMFFSCNNNKCRQRG